MQAKGAALVSEDQDYFRYTDHSYSVYTAFKVSNDGLLVLEKHPGPNPNREAPSPRPLLMEPLPETVESSPSLLKLKNTGEGRGRGLGWPNPA